VDLDVERNQFTENALRYEASLTMINMQIKGMLAAIQGQ
jgi:flagellar basal-body rod protein FlgB